MVVEHVHYPQQAMDCFHPLACLNFSRSVADASGFGLQRWPVEFIVSGAVADHVSVPEDRIAEIVEETRKHTILNCPASAA